MTRALADEERVPREQVTSELEMAMLLEEISLRQKSCSCMLWLKGVDKNAKFFQSLANSHHRSNTIVRLYVHGEEITNQTNKSI